MAVVLAFNQQVLRKAFQQSVHPTLGIRRHFQAFFYAVSFFCLDGVPPPTPAQVTQTVRCYVQKQNQEQMQRQVSYTAKASERKQSWQTRRTQ